MGGSAGHGVGATDRGRETVTPGAVQGGRTAEPVGGPRIGLTPRADAPAPCFEVEDARYCRLQPIGDREVSAWHEGDGDGGPEPAAWTTRRGDARIAVDVLGHDERSYDSEGHRALIARMARWAARAG